IKAINSKRILFNIRLEIVGAESPDFSHWLDNLTLNNNVRVIRYGVKPHGFVLEKMHANMIYCYPSMHPGEGHSNSINEAMMSCLIIISSKAGFLADVLDNCAYLIQEDEDIVDAIVDRLIKIKAN